MFYSVKKDFCIKFKTNTKTKSFFCYIVTHNEWCKTREIMNVAYSLINKKKLFIYCSEKKLYNYVKDRFVYFNCAAITRNTEHYFKKKNVYAMDGEKMNSNIQKKKMYSDRPITLTERNIEITKMYEKKKHEKINTYFGHATTDNINFWCRTHFGLFSLFFNHF